MFLLPVDKIFEKGLTPAGKQTKIPTWNLTAIVQPGVAVNAKEICPGKDHPHYKEHNIGLEISLGEECLLTTRLDKNRFVFSKNIADTEHPERKTLCVKLYGKPFSPDLVEDNHVVVDIDIVIEGISIMPAFEREGVYTIAVSQVQKIPGGILGENGQYTIEIYTPIYVWLLAHL